MITPEEDGYAAFPVSLTYVQKHGPQVGGYYVQYEGGYESWSPAQAFEEGNTRIATSYVQRLLDEKAALEDKVIKLGNFIGSSVYQGLVVDERADLNDQYEHMARYLAILSRRAVRVTPAPRIEGAQSSEAIHVLTIEGEKE